FLGSRVRLRTRAPAAASRFRATPTIVVAMRPREGSSTNPVSAAPRAAPTVFAAYSSAISRAHFAPVASFAPFALLAPLAPLAPTAETTHTPTGKLAPIAAPGNAITAIDAASRVAPNNTPPAPSAYAHASNGRSALIASGIASAHSA